MRQSAFKQKKTLKVVSINLESTQKSLKMMNSRMEQLDQILTFGNTSSDT